MADDPPLLAGQIHGLRRWSLGLEDGRIRLGSSFRDFWWDPGGAATTATCGEGSLRRHRPPGKRCGCGLYALHPGPESASEVFPVQILDGLPSEVSGIVEAWGRVEVYETGFRAQFARPVALILHRDQLGTDWGELVERIARAYRADVLIVSRSGEVTEYCREHDLGLAPGTVAELVPRDQQDAISERVTGRSPGRWTLDGLAGGALAVVVGLIGLAFWLAIWGGIALAILGAILGWFGDGSPSATSIARKHLTVIDQAVLGAASREPVYAAVIRNEDRRRAALDVAPRLRVRGGDRVARLAGSGRFDRPANVPPGGIAVAVDLLRAVPVGELAQPVLEVGAFRRVGKFPVEHVTVRLDRRRCALMAEVISSRRLDRLTLIGIARRDGRIAGGGEFRVDSVPRGRSTHDLGKPGARSCGADPPRWSLYPDLAFQNGEWGS